MKKQEAVASRINRITPSVSLHAKTARELMTPGPLSIHEGASVQEAADFLYTKGISAAPVINEAGRPIGVISLMDLVWYQRDQCARFRSQHEYFQLDTSAGTPVERKECCAVIDIMTPAVFSVKGETPCHQVVEEMVRSKIHRLFVVDEQRILIGVISALDVMRDLVKS